MFPPPPLYNVDMCMKSHPEVYVMINIVFGGKGGLFQTILERIFKSLTTGLQQC